MEIAWTMHVSFPPLTSDRQMLPALTYSALLAAHVLASAAWFGAMFYSFTVLQPRAKAYFRETSRFEDFTAFVAAGARWKVIGGATFIAATGCVLLLARESPTSLRCVLIAAKAVLLCLALTIFAYASWWLWPQRLFAAEREAHIYQRRFAAVALSLIVIVALCFVLSILAAHGLQ